MDDVIVELRHCVGVDGKRYCAPGLRIFFHRHALDMRAFLREGLPATVIESTGDAMAIRAADNARKERGARWAAAANKP